MASLRLSVMIVLFVCVAAPAAEKPFGLARRIPWNDSRVVGSPEPPLPVQGRAGLCQADNQAAIEHDP